MYIDKEDFAYSWKYFLDTRDKDGWDQGAFGYKREPRGGNKPHIVSLSYGWEVWAHSSHNIMIKLSSFVWWLHKVWKFLITMSHCIHECIILV